MFLTELGDTWARNNKEWLQQLFSRWDSVELEVLCGAEGYEYILHNVTLKTRFGTVCSYGPIEKGAVCGAHGGLTKSGEPCKKPGKYTGNRCHAHPAPMHTVLYSEGTIIPQLKMSIGLDNKRRPLPLQISCSDITFVINDGAVQPLDFIGTPAWAFDTVYAIVNRFIASCEDHYGLANLTFSITCHLGTIHASPVWPIDRLRNMLNYYGPWRTSKNELVALQGYFVGDYTPGLWT